MTGNGKGKAMGSDRQWYEINNGNWQCEMTNNGKSQWEWQTMENVK